MVLLHSGHCYYVGHNREPAELKQTCYLRLTDVLTDDRVICATKVERISTNAVCFQANEPDFAFV